MSDSELDGLTSCLEFYEAIEPQKDHLLRNLHSDLLSNTSLPIELKLQSLRIQLYDEVVNNIGLRAQKDLMDELNIEVNNRRFSYQR